MEPAWRVNLPFVHVRHSVVPWKVLLPFSHSKHSCTSSVSLPIQPAGHEENPVQVCTSLVTQPIRYEPAGTWTAVEPPPRTMALDSAEGREKRRSLIKLKGKNVRSEINKKEIYCAVQKKFKH